MAHKLPGRGERIKKHKDNKMKMKKKVIKKVVKAIKKDPTNKLKKALGKVGAAHKKKGKPGSPFIKAAKKAVLNKPILTKKKNAKLRKKKK